MDVDRILSDLLEGAAHLGELGESLFVHKTQSFDPLADLEALRGDWEHVGRDLAALEETLDEQLRSLVAQQREMQETFQKMLEGLSVDERSAAVQSVQDALEEALRSMESQWASEEPLRKSA